MKNKYEVHTLLAYSNIDTAFNGICDPISPLIMQSYFENIKLIQ